jgi:hypothetical protein
MNVIRFNKKKISKILLILFILYLIKYILEWFFRTEEPSLSYNELNRKFYIKLNRVYIRNIRISDPSRDHSEFYHLDENDNIEVETKEENLKRPFQIKSALIIYSKILVENWVYAIEKAVDLGVNTIEIEIPWNIHEPIENKYDFTSYSNDLETFIKLVHSYGLYIIVRIDPYIPCSIYDFGGLPSWLLSQNDLANKILFDSNDNKFAFLYKKYLDKLLPIIYSNQLIKNGPIIGILIQQYDYNSQIAGSSELLKYYDKNYASLIQRMLNSHNIVELLLKSHTMCDSESESYNSYCDNSLSIYFPVENKLNPKLFTKFFSSTRHKNFKQNCFGNHKYIFIYLLFYLYT